MEQSQKVIAAIFSIKPNAEFMIGGEYDFDALKWKDKVQVKPTKAEFNNAVEAWNAEYDAQEYARNRQYPSIGDQMDMQYHDLLNNTTTWKDAIAKVKSDNPKE